MIFGNGDELGLSAAADDAKYAIANFPTADIFADRFDFARELESRNLLCLTRRRRITTEPLQNVRAIYSGGAHSHTHAIGSWLRRVSHFADFEAFDAAEESDDYGLHCCLFEECSRATDHVVNIEPQVLQRHITRRRRAKAIETNHVASFTNVTIPTLSNPGFDREPS